MSFERGRRRRLAQRKGRGGDSIVVDLIARQGWWLLPALLALATFIAFLPVLENRFVNWDDDRNLLDNPDYRGLGWPQLRWMFTAVHLGHYIPLTWLTFGLDYVLWGMNPAGYHLTNLVLHMANAVVFYAIAVRLLAAALPGMGEGIAVRLGGAVAALLFAVHPLRVESVAWVTERRDVLCGLFYLLAVLAHLRACAVGPAAGGLWRRWYWGTVGLGALALLSKSMAVSLPVVLLVLDVYPLGRLGGSWEGWVGTRARRVWAEKVPLVVLSGAASVAALVALARNQGMNPIDKVGGVERVAISVYSLAFYLWKMVVPASLSPLYALPERIEPSRWPYLVAGVVVAAVSAAALLRRRRWPGLAAAWVSYVVILLPVLGIVQNGPQIAADRYTYLAGSGWALLVGGALAAWCAAGARHLLEEQRAVVVAGAGVLVAVALGALTWRQAQVWHDPRSLWTHALSTHPSAIAHHNLGVFILGRGERADAVGHFRRAIALKPDYVEAHNNLGAALLQQGDAVEAIEHFRRALAIKPEDANAHTNLGVALARQGRRDEAVRHYQEAVTINPGHADAHNNLGNALLQQGQVDEAVRHYRAALRVRPRDAEAHHNLGLALARQGRRSEAAEHFREALAIKPGLREAQENLDQILAGSSPTK